MDSCHASLRVAASVDHAFAIAFGQKILLSDTAALDSVSVINETQNIEALTFARTSIDGPLNVVSAGESKMIHFYDVNTALRGEDKPWYSYGPHTKRITHVVACEAGTIIFCDKFGEVHLLDVSPSATRENKQVGSRFLLQHFSFFSCLFVSNSVSNGSTSFRRLFTCDRDCRVRVSHYPEVFRIEQFLWYQSSPSVTTVVTEILPPSVGDDVKHYALGHHDGSVSFWQALNTAASDTLNSVSLKHLHAPPEEKKSVVGLCHMEEAAGVLIGYDSNQVAFIPVITNGGELTVQENLTQTLSLPHPVIAMVKCESSAALVVTRDGVFHFVHLTNVNGSFTLSLRAKSIDGLRIETFSLANPEGKCLLWDVSIEDQWKSDAKDPRNRKRSHDSDDEAES